MVPRHPCSSRSDIEDATVSRMYPPDLPKCRTAGVVARMAGGAVDRPDHAWV